MGVIPLHVSSSATTSDHCRLCAEVADQKTATTHAARHVRLVVPAVLVAGLVVLLFLVGNATLDTIALGVGAGAITAAVYVVARRGELDRAVEQRHAAEFRKISEEADGRVKAVITQFEWAVNDVATLRRRLDESESALRTLSERARKREHQNEQLVRQISRLRERLTEIAMAASLAEQGKKRPAPLFEAVPFTWRLEHERARTRLALETAMTTEAPTRVRMVDADGQVLAASGVAVLSLDGTIAFELEPPLEVAAELEAGREISYEIEARVDDEWRRVALRRCSTHPLTEPARAVRIGETRTGPEERRSALN